MQTSLFTFHGGFFMFHFSFICVISFFLFSYQFAITTMQLTENYKRKSAFEIDHCKPRLNVYAKCNSLQFYSEKIAHHQLLCPDEIVQKKCSAKKRKSYCNLKKKLQGEERKKFQLSKFFSRFDMPRDKGMEKERKKTFHVRDLSHDGKRV